MLLSFLDPLLDIFQQFMNAPFMRAIAGVFENGRVPAPVFWLVLGACVFAGLWVGWKILPRIGKKNRLVQSLLENRQFFDLGEYYFSVNELEKARNYYLQADAPAKAGIVSERLRNFKEAGDYFAEARDWDRAVVNYQKAGLSEKVVSILHEQGRVSEAAVYLKSIGKLKEAAQSYEQAMDFENAAALYREVQMPSRSGDMLHAELTKRIRSTRGNLSPNEWKIIRSLAKRGAEDYQQGNELEKAADLLLKGDYFEEAADLLQACGKPEKAGECFEKIRQYEKAAQIFEQHGFRQKAHRMWGEHFKSQSQNIEAADHFMKGEAFLTAGDLWLQVGETERAAECFEKGGDYAEAAGIFARAKHFEKAAKCFEAANQFDHAAENYQKAGKFLKQAECLTKIEKPFLAGEIYYRQGQVERAIPLLQEISDQHPDYQAASSLLGKIFMDKGMVGVAQKKFEEVISADNLRPQHLEPAYYLGVLYEQAQKLSEAEAIYEKIIAIQYDFKDVATRLGKIQLEISRQKESGSSPKLYDTTRAMPPTDLVAATQRDTSGASPIDERFEVVGEIGRGGMGIVYKAKDRILNRVVALKYLPANFAQNVLAVRNFQREAQSTASLNHPGIITVYDVGFDKRGNFIAMEFLEGFPIKDYIRRKGALDLDPLFRLSIQMAEALHYAHENRVIHRDIKTSNMMWLKGDRVKIMDFGLAKFMQEAKNNVTQISGTPYYMSPEQTLGKPLDYRTDLYSFGVSLFEMACGTVPFKDGDIGYHHINTPAPDILTINPNIPAKLKQIIETLMQKKPEDRDGPASKLANDLRNAYEDYKAALSVST